MKRDADEEAIALLDAALAEATALLVEFRDRLRYREPENNDDYCRGCGCRLPHAPGCIVPRLAAFVGPAHEAP